MSDQYPEPQNESTPSRFSGIHTRTFEAELLISGAVVFGLFQVQPVISRFFDEMLVRVEGPLRLVVLLGQTYLLLIIYALLGAFLLHLGLRAFWIGLVGLESVYPGGIKWDRVKAGPFFIENSRKLLGSLAQIIDRVDDLCSLIFSFGFMMVIVFIYMTVVVLVSTVAGFLASRLLFGGRWSAEAFWVIFGMLIGFPVVSQLVDRLVGPRVRTDGVAGRAIASMTKISSLVSPLRWLGPTTLTLQSNTSEKRVSMATNVVMLTLATGVMVVMFVQAGMLRFDSLVYFPTSLRAHGVDPRHYRDLREEGSIEPKMPTIQSDVVEGPYLKLVIPYFPRRHNPLIRERCPDVVPFRPSGLVFGRPDPPDGPAYRSAVDCLASLFPIEIDGESLQDSRFDFTQDPVSGLEAIVTYIPLGGLEPGRHELLIEVPSRGMAEGDADDAEPVRHLIPFWR